MNSYNVLKNKWGQVCFDIEMGVNRVVKSRMPGSGILCNKISLSTVQSSSGIIVSALPERGAAIISEEWCASEIPTSIVPFDGMPLCSLGFPEALSKPLRIHPFVKKVNPDALKHVLALKNVLSFDKYNENITVEESHILGVCYDPQKDIDVAVESFGFRRWEQCRLQPRVSVGVFTSFIAKIEEGVQISFWGAPILTADGKVKSIVVYQQDLGDETVAIVGMQFNSFIDSIPLLSNQIA